MKKNIIFLALSIVLVLAFGVGAQLITGSISLSQIAGTLNLATQVTGVLLPTNGGAGAMTGAPAWARYFGDGSEGPGPANGAITVPGEHWYSSWTCTGAITPSTNNGAIVVRSTGAVALNTGCTINATRNGVVTISGNFGGAGGSGGSGAANSAASIASAYFNVLNNASLAPYNYSAAGAASSSSAGNAGGVISVAAQHTIAAFGYPSPPSGGGTGTAGGSTGGAGGTGGEGIIIIAPTITIASGVILNADGGPGVAPTANSTGAGGGGGGGNIMLFSESFTDNGAIYKYGGGSGGAITQPSIQAAGDGCNTAGCGTGAVFTVTGLTTGGLDATKITITNAGSGYNVAPTCLVNAGGSGLIGSPACHFTVSGGAIASVVIDTAGSGGVLTTFTTTFIGGYGANGFFEQALIQ